MQQDTFFVQKKKKKMSLPCFEEAIKENYLQINAILIKTYDLVYSIIIYSSIIQAKMFKIIFIYFRNKYIIIETYRLCKYIFNIISNA